MKSEISLDTGKQATSSCERKIRLLSARAHRYRIQLILLRRFTGENAPARILAGQNQVFFILKRQEFYVPGNHQAEISRHQKLHWTRLWLCTVYQSLRDGAAGFLWPCEWFQNFQLVDEPTLPPHEAFHSYLKKENISQEAYALCRTVWKDKNWTSVRDHLE